LASRGTTLVEHLLLPSFQDTGWNSRSHSEESNCGGRVSTGINDPALYPLPFNGGSFRQSLLTVEAYRLSVCSSGVYFSSFQAPGRTVPRLSVALQLLTSLRHRFYFIPQAETAPVPAGICLISVVQPATPEGTSPGRLTG